eukprot:m.89580 g.89580  ORF g.89580 m.89580 type:complete len:652 (+) comp14976_c1_seq3:89-2044(+)
MGGSSSHDVDDPEVDEVRTMNKADFAGPVANRRCRDSSFMLIFVAFWGGMLLIGGESIKHGQPLRLIHGHDSFGNLCGEANSQQINSSNSGLDLRNRSYLFYFGVPELDLQLCVEDCPGLDASCADCATNSSCLCQSLGVCLNSSDGTYILSPATPGDIGGCADDVYESADLLRLRRCLPKEAGSLAQNIYNVLNTEDILHEIFADFYNARFEIGACAGAAVALSLLIIVLMRCIVAPAIYSVVFIAIAATVGLTGFLWLEYRDLKLEVETDNENQEKYLPDSENERLFFGLAIVASVFTLLFLCLLYYLWPRIRFVIAIFQEASKIMARIPQVLFLPLLTTFFLALFFAYWIVVFLYLSTTAEPVANEDGHVEYVERDDYAKLWWYHLFGLFWTSQFILACEEMTIAGAVAYWYFTFDKKTVKRTVRRSIWHVLRYHLGTVAFGSLLIAIVKFLRAVLQYIERRLRRKGSTGRLVVLMLRCCSCCLWCFDKCLKFLNKNAYIEVAIYGYSFCVAAREAFKILTANVLRVLAINSLGTFCLFLSKIAVVAGSGLIAVLWLRGNPDLHYFGFVVLAICVFAWFIAGSFIGVYKMAIDTLVICFCEDHKHNNGKDKPFFMSENLKRFISTEERRAQKETEKQYLLAKQYDVDN